MIRVLNFYILRRHIAGLLMALSAALILVLVSDLVDLSGRIADGVQSAPPVLVMAMLHAPSILSETLPFIVLLGSLAAFLRLARTSELVVIRAAGLSVWRILQMPVLGALVLGCLAFAVWNPIAATTLSRYEVLKSRHFDGQESQLSISAEGLWLRQADADGQTVINASRASPFGDELIGVLIFEFDTDGVLDRRMSARRAVLTPGAWQVEQARIWQMDSAGTFAMVHGVDRETVIVPTDLTSSRILESFADPQELSFWNLQEFIGTLESSGFSSTRHRLYMQTELAQPLMFVAMVLIAAGFSMRHVRFGSVGVRILLCVIAGFGIFFLSDFTQALGSAGTIPVIVAAWVPPIAALLLATSLLLHLEDG
ncbi:LPS export ABC transporter permease LptG [Pontivivens nitratireducens]|uniref:LPS export ABC transporter permease LptG n=1 Tax=Pontivivens nitratireducens TaxID=2758038 RepID=UPI001639D06F|nr:LPS export ABC transporter permease LptG [Pontibrevibacter nitratireducens]